MILDNHSAHKSYAIRHDLEGFHVLYTPPYSSFLNSQETVWAGLKKELAEKFARTETDFKT